MMLKNLFFIILCVFLFCFSLCTASGDTAPAIAAPDLKIIDVQMISPDTLGIGIAIRYPENCPRSANRTVTCTAIINNVSVIRTFDITALTPEPENKVTIGLDQANNTDSTTPLRINLSDEHIPRFIGNIDFFLSAVATCDGGQASKEQNKQVVIPLPVVVLHGYVTAIDLSFGLIPGVEPIEIKGYPAMNTDAPSGSSSANSNMYRIGFYEYAYRPLSDALNKAGYTVSGSGEDRYVTLWDPRDPNISYSSLSYATPDNLRHDFSRVYQDVIEHSYASKFNIIGHSTGGLIARFWADQNPDVISRIITVGTPHEGICRFYEEPFSQKYSSKKDYTEKELRYNNSPNLITWFVPRWDDAVQYSSRQGPDPVWNNTFDYGYPNADYYLIYKQTNTKTDKDVRINLRPDQQWYDEEIANRTYGNGDGFVYDQSAAARITGPAESSTFHRIAVAATKNHEQLCADENVIAEILTCLADKDP